MFLHVAEFTSIFGLHVSQEMFKLAMIVVSETYWN